MNAYRLCFPLLTILAAACVPQSNSLGDDGPEPGSTTDEPTEPIAEAQVRWKSILDDVAGVDAALAPDGSIYVLGASGYHYEGGDGGDFDNLWLGKFDDSGALQWEVEQPNVEGTLNAVAISVSAQDEVYVATIDYSTLEGGNNLVRKYDADGSEQWSTALPARARALYALPGGGVVVGGGQAGEPNKGRAYVQALNADGASRWERVIGDPQARWSEISAFATASDGALLLGGRMGIDPVSSRAQAWTAAVDPVSGDTRWESTLSSGVATDQVHALGVTDDGTIMALGHETSPWVKSLAPDGAQRSTWLNEAAGGARSMAVSPDGSFALTDSVYLDIEDPDACFDVFSPCPVAMRVAMFEADQSPRWLDQRDDCTYGNAVRATADGGLVVLAGCGSGTAGEAAMGLFRYEP